MDKYFWFSFSHKGKNNGVCLIKANSSQEASEKLFDLKLAPEADDIQIFEIDNEEIPLNKLIPAEDMLSNGYKLKKF